MRNNLEGLSSTLTDLAKNDNVLTRGSDTSTADLNLSTRGSTVLVDIRISDPSHSSTVVGLLESWKSDVTGSYETLISAYVPISRLEELGQQDQVRSVTQASAITRVGSVHNEAYEALELDVLAVSPKSAASSAASAEFGDGITIGILSDSFASISGGYEADISSEDLPAGIEIIKESDYPESDEGRAMAQLVHDLAPGSELKFHTAFGGKAGFANGIIALKDAGANVIVDDVGYLNEYFFQDDVIAQAIDEVTDAGVSYFSSAGNSGPSGFEAVFEPSDVLDRVYTWMDFSADGSDDIGYDLRILPGETITFSFQWSDPIVPGQTSTVNDLDFYLLTSDFQTVLTGSYEDQSVYPEPWEVFSWTNSGSSAVDAAIAIGLYSGSGQNLTIRGVSLDNDPVLLDDYPSLFQGPTSWGHTGAQGTMSVGASFYWQTPHWGVDPAVINDYSSSGDVNFFYDKNGAPYAGGPQVRDGLDFVAPDGTNTTFFGQDAGDPNPAPNFFGTSAAAPHAAAVAAIMLQEVPTLTPASVRQVLRDTARDMDDPDTTGFDTGWDRVSGAGLIDGNAAVSFLRSENVRIEGLVSGADGANDTLSGYAVSDTMYGLGGTDTLNGFAGDDILDVGPGSSSAFQYANGDAGDDTYVYSKGYGLVFINPNREGSGDGTADKVVFTDLNYEDLTISYYDYSGFSWGAGFGNAIRLSWNDGSSSGELRIGQEGQYIETFEFADGSTRTAAELLENTITGTESGETLNGTAVSDTMYGLGGTDTLNGLAGDDILDVGPGSSSAFQYANGDAGDDTYVYSKGYGLVFINPNREGSGDGTADKVVFTDLNYEDLTISYYDYSGFSWGAGFGNAIRLSWNDGSSSGELRIGQEGQYIETFEFADGSTRTAAELVQKFPDSFPSTSSATVNGTSAGDTIIFGDFIAHYDKTLNVYAGDGANKIEFGKEASQHNGEIWVWTGVDNDLITFGNAAAYSYGHTEVSTGAGNDIVEFGDQAAHADGWLAVILGPGEDKVTFGDQAGTRGFNTVTNVEWASEGLLEVDLGVDNDRDELIFNGSVDGLIVYHYIQGIDAKIAVPDPSKWTLTPYVAENGHPQSLLHDNGEYQIHFSNHANSTPIAAVSDILKAHGADDDQSGAPVFLSSSNLITRENTVSTGYFAEAIDPNGESITYSIVGGADADKFRLDPRQYDGTQQLWFKNEQDFETPSSSANTNKYLVKIQATNNSGLSSYQDVQIEVADLNEDLNIQNFGNSYPSTSSATVNGTSAEDTIIFGDFITHYDKTLNVYAGDGANKIEFGKEASQHNGEIWVWTGVDNDLITFGNAAAYSYGHTEVSTGAGNDIVEFGDQAAHADGWLAVILGPGEDKVTFGDQAGTRGFNTVTNVEWASEGLLEVDLGVDNDRDELIFNGSVDGLIVYHYIQGIDAKIAVPDPSKWTLTPYVAENGHPQSLLHDNGEYQIHFSNHANSTPIAAVSDVLKVKESTSASNWAFKVSSEGTSDKFGWSVSNVGDVDNDGLADFVLASDDFNDKNYLVFGSSLAGLDLYNIAPSILDVGIPFNGRLDEDGSVTYSVSGIGDVDGDGVDDLLLSNWVYYQNFGNTENATILLGSYLKELKESGASAFNVSQIQPGDGLHISNNQSPWFGWSNSRAGDVDGDGLNDILIGDHRYDHYEWNYDTSQLYLWGEAAGAAHIIYGSQIKAQVDQGNTDLVPNRGEGWFTDQFGLTIHGKELDFAGYAVSEAGDLDGDGLSDILIGANENGPPWDQGLATGNGFGKTFIMFGDEIKSLKDSGTWDEEVRAVGHGHTIIQLNGSELEEAMGSSLTSLGDLDGDGLDEFAIGSSVAGAGDTNWDADGRFYIVFGEEISAMKDANNLSASLNNMVHTQQWESFEGDARRIGFVLEGSGDIDNDGLQDLLVGTRGSGHTYFLPGRVIRDAHQNGSLTNNIENHEGVVRIKSNDGDFGWTVDFAGDIDGDGYDDVVVGEPTKWVSGGSTGGSVYFISGQEIAYYSETDNWLIIQDDLGLF